MLDYVPSSMPTKPNPLGLDTTTGSRRYFSWPGSAIAAYTHMLLRLIIWIDLARLFLQLSTLTQQEPPYSRQVANLQQRCAMSRYQQSSCKNLLLLCSRMEPSSITATGTLRLQTTQGLSNKDMHRVSCSARSRRYLTNASIPGGASQSGIRP